MGITLSANDRTEARGALKGQPYISPGQGPPERSAGGAAALGKRHLTSNLSFFPIRFGAMRQTGLEKKREIILGPQPRAALRLPWAGINLPFQGVELG